MESFHELLARVRSQGQFYGEEGVVLVSTRFEEGGRWSNFRYSVYCYMDDFFEVCQEVSASECQEGMDLEFDVYEVEPKERMVTEYERVL